MLLMFGDHVRAYVPVADLLADAVATPLWVVIVTGPFAVALGMTAWIQARCWYGLSVLVPPIRRDVGTLTWSGLISKRMSLLLPCT